MEELENCHTLLGILPTSGSDEIEEAYRRKKSEHDPGQFAEGTPEWVNAAAMQKKLEQAYNDAVMATFAPIRVFSAPNPPPAPPQPRSPSPRPHRPPVTGGGNDSHPRSWAPTPQQNPRLDGLVEEAPVSVSDADLLKMDVSQLREMYAPPPPKTSPLFTLGIEDPLLRSYVRMFLTFTVLDFLLRVAMGNVWEGMSGIFSRLPGVLSALNEGLPTVGTNAPPAPPSALWSLVTSVVSMVYLFACSLVMPIAVRFFLMGEPATGSWTMRLTLDVGSIMAAWVIMLPVGLIFRILPAEWAGSDMNLLFVTPLLCDATIKYGG
ncbi:MAG: hypothetical protein LBQ90_00010 [Synergistaceae bacterium]|nr:hypothetical protein [Synergistaceae bacterium]